MTQSLDYSDKMSKKIKIELEKKSQI